MMSFKAFLETQDDSITDEEALAKVKKNRDFYLFPPVYFYLSLPSVFLSFPPQCVFIFRRTVVVISSEPRFFQNFSKFNENRILLEANFLNLDHSSSFPGAT